MSFSRSQKFNHDWGYNKGLFKQATSFFFTNIPKDWSYNEMWTTFGKYGRVISIYSPQRKSQSRRRFSFVRYLEIKNVRDLEEKLDQIWVEGWKIWVNIAKYPEEKIVTKKIRIDSAPSIVVKGKSYADAVKGLEGIKYSKTRTQLKKTSPEMEPKKNRSILKNSKTEQRQIWKVKNRGVDWRGLEYNVKQEDYEWLQGCYVGIAHSVEMVPNLQEKFYMEGYFSCRLGVIGGEMVLMDCEDKEELKDLVQGAADWLGQWFFEVKPWSPLMVAKERFVWIRSQGSPLQAWGPIFFESMATSWGKFICLDNSTSQKRRFDIARFLISTPIMEFILVKRQIKVNGEGYFLKFTEEEMTNNLFSLRYDFKPSFKSESDHEEYWSDASDYDDEWQDEEYGTNRERAGEEEEAIGDTVGHNTNDRRHATSSTHEVEFELQERSVEAGQFEKVDRSYQCQLREEENAEEVADSIDNGTMNDVEDRVDMIGREMGARTENQTSSNAIHVAGDEVWAEQGVTTKTNMGHKQNDVEGMKQKQWACNQMGTREQRTHSSLLRAEKGSEDSSEMEGRCKTQREIQGEQSRKRGISRMLANSCDLAAGSSVGDSGIENCNRILKEEQSRKTTVDLWNFAKEIAQMDFKGEAEQLLEEEIKRRREAFIVLRDNISSKALGPDRFNFKFVKDRWEVIKEDVVEFLQEFQENSKLVKGINNSFIVLVPKVDNPQKIEEYRPISLIGVIVYDAEDGLLCEVEELDTRVLKNKSGFSPAGLNGLVSTAVLKDLLQGEEVGLGGFKVSHLHHLIGTCVEEEWIEKMSWVISCKKGLFPFKYLGIPIGESCKKIAFWKPLVDVFKSKLSKWRGWHLSLGGRITLINSVLFGLPVFWMSVYLIPKGEGVSISFWWDNWRGKGYIANKYPRLYSLSTGKDNKIPQMGEWVNGDWKWNLQWRRNLFSWETQQVEELQKDIQDTSLIKGKPDLWEWAHSKDGGYLTGSAYQTLTMEGRSDQHGMELQNVWNKLIPNKISAFSWQLLQDKIPTKLNLHKRGIIQALEECKCVMCGKETEDYSHLLIHYKFAWHLWNECFNWWGIISVLDKDRLKVFEQHSNLLKRVKLKEGWECIWFGIVWTIWLARNEKIFRGKEADKRRLLELVQLRTFSWLNCRRGGCVFSLTDWLHNPADCLTNNCSNRRKLNGIASTK
ncbi:hypothetical protein SLEP1_g15313 [Rubroshorea leprosula]|uniref:RRM domain-containing protein n=1 Tax=Rubroshorea leprosula TaxID=152421 RepID=A0AAV5ISX5_9ROSI|nr:hypothetical protein SLEP1_g15313 [Rubroshorea leprosula]